MGRLLKLGFFICLAVYFFLTVIMTAPAEWVASAAVKSVPGLSLSGVSGTVWSGRAAGAHYRYMGDNIDFGGLSWKSGLLSLLGLKVCAEIDSGLVDGDVCQGIGGKTEFKKLKVNRLPASMFDKHIGVASLGGVASVDVRHAQIAKNGAVKKLDGKLDWRSAQVNAGDGWFQLGSFAADLGAGEDGGITFKLFDLDGNFNVDIRGAFSYKGQPSLKGTVKPKPEAPAPLVDGLRVFSQETNDGTFQVAWPIGS